MRKLLFKDGISSTPSDYASDQLSLSRASNVLNDGELRAYPPFKELFTLPQDVTPLIIHEVNNVSYYICTQGSYIKAFSITGSSTIEFLDFSVDISSFGEYHSANIIGNTVALLFSSGIHYILYSDGGYKYLGTNPPRADITFDLKGRLSRSAEFTIKLSGEAKDALTDEDKETATNTLMAEANKFIAQKATEKGLFIFPFFVRYAYRLYDGSHIMHSAPVLMLPSTYQGVKALIYNLTSPEDVPNSPDESPETDTRTTARIAAFVHRLIIKSAYVDYKALSLWRDIVEGIDIFVSAPIYNYDPNGKVEAIVPFSSATSIDNAEELDYGIYEPYASKLHSGKHYFYDAYLEARTFGAYSKDDMPDEDEALPEDGNDPIPAYMYLLPRKKTKTIFDDIKTNSLFYRVASWKAENYSIPSSLDIEGEILSTIQLQPTLEDDYNSNDAIAAKHSYSYNSRLHISDITQSFYSGHKADTMAPYTQPFGSRPIYDIYTYIKDLSGEKIVKSTSTLPVSLLGEYLYYPSHKAYKMVVVKNIDNTSTEDVVYFDLHASLMVSEDKDTGEKTWAITINPSPDILSATDITVSGAIEFTSGAGGSTYQATLYADNPAYQVPLGIPYIAGQEVLFASLTASCSSSAYKPYKITFDYISGIQEYTNSYPSSNPATTEWAELRLEEHPLLNGAYHFSCFKDYKWNKENIPTITLTSPAVHIHNKIYTSDVDNPFRFPVEGVTTIGDGAVLGMAVATQALSQGQFGEFPLYAFTTDGVWALYLNDKGTFSAARPLSRDVCSHASSITQTDTGVIFATSAGLIHLHGSSTTPLSSKLSYPLFDTSKLPAIDVVADTEGITIIPDNTPFLTYISEAQISYDYINSHILVHNHKYPYIYLYSFTSKTWTCIEGQIKQVLNSYPELKIITAEDKVITTNSKSASFENRKGAIVTRPFTLSRDTYKTISQLVIRGSIPPSSHYPIRCLLYGSRDGENYFLVKAGLDRIRQSHGSGYKYFVLYASFNLPSNATISCVDIDYTERQTNKFR